MQTTKRRLKQTIRRAYSRGCNESLQILVYEIKAPLHGKS